MSWQSFQNAKALQQELQSQYSNILSSQDSYSNDEMTQTKVDNENFQAGLGNQIATEKAEKGTAKGEDLFGGYEIGTGVTSILNTGLKGLGADELGGTIGGALKQTLFRGAGAFGDYVEENIGHNLLPRASNAISSLFSSTNRNPYRNTTTDSGVGSGGDYSSTGDGTGSGGGGTEMTSFESTGNNPFYDASNHDELTGETSLNTAETSFDNPVFGMENSEATVTSFGRSPPVNSLDEITQLNPAPGVLQNRSNMLNELGQGNAERSEASEQWDTLQFVGEQNPMALTSATSHPLEIQEQPPSPDALDITEPPPSVSNNGSGGNQTSVSNEETNTGTEDLASATETEDTSADVLGSVNRTITDVGNNLTDQLGSTLDSTLGEGAGDIISTVARPLVDSVAEEATGIISAIPGFDVLAPLVAVGFGLYELFHHKDETAPPPPPVSAPTTQILNTSTQVQTVQPGI